MLNLLAIESGGAQCSVALSFNGRVFSRRIAGARAHSEHLLPFIQALMIEADGKVSDLDALAFSAGPGSFTGIRLGASVTKALAYAAKKPVIPVDSLHVVAQTCFRQHPDIEKLTVINDARMEEAYVADFEKTEEDVCRRLTKSRLVPVSGLNNLTVSVAACDKRDLLPQATRFYEVTPEASDLLELAAVALSKGKTETAASAVPVYLRGKSSWKTRDEQKTGR